MEIIETALHASCSSQHVPLVMLEEGWEKSNRLEKTFLRPVVTSSREISVAVLSHVSPVQLPMSETKDLPIAGKKAHSLVKYLFLEKHQMFSKSSF